MVGELITFPLRVGVRATQLWLRAAEETVAVAAGVTGRLIDSALPRPPKPRAQPAGPRAESDLLAPERDARERDFEASEIDEVSAREAEVQIERGPDPEPEPEPQPTHVSEDPVLVEQVADPGAEDGAGASVHVEEPWNGYAHMKADDVIARLSGASPAELAAVQLYEQAGKGRVTVLEAVERELRISSGSGSHT